MTAREWDGLCTDCHNEVGAFIVDGTRRVVGFQCIAAALSAAPTLAEFRAKLAAWMERNRR